MRPLLLGILVLASTACGATAKAPACPEVTPVGTAPTTTPPPALAPAGDQLAQLARLAGEWRGEGKGQPGTSSVERTYRWVLGGKYLESRNRSTYEPQPENPKGEVHEDVGYISYDKARKKLVSRQFHVEGFVNQYVLDSSTADDFVFVSEAIENIPAGFRARESLRLIGDDQLEETFEIAEPDKDFEVYSKTTLTRVKPST
jgi:hypothetical protein